MYQNNGSASRRSRKRRRRNQNRAQATHPPPTQTFQWLELEVTTLPESLYQINHAGSRTIAGDGFKAPRQIGHSPNDEQAIEVTRRHLNWLNTEESWWISTFGNKDHARRWAEIWRVNNPNLYCRMEILNTKNIKTRIFNAVTFIQYFGIPLKQDLDISQFNDEYLVTNYIPATAVRASVPFVTVGEEESATELSTSTTVQKVARIPPVNIRYVESFNLVNLPIRLFRIIYAGGKALYKDNDEGLTAHRQVYPPALSDKDFKKSIQLQVTGDDEVANRYLHIMFATFSNRASALKRAQAHQQRLDPCAMALAHIDTSKLGDSGSRWVYHAAYVIKKLQIPLKQGQHISQFYHEYLVINRVPAEAIL